MAGKNVPVVLVQRFTGYVGDGIYATQPIPVAAYSRVTVGFWHGALIGSGLLVLSVDFGESNDLSTWRACAGGPWTLPVGAGEALLSADLSQAWLMFRVSLLGANVGVTCWAQGFFELRER